VKRIRGEEPIRVVIHVCMKMSCENCSKNIMFFFNLLTFFSTKSENKRAEQVLWGGVRGGVGISGKGRWQGKEIGG
jgi:hypothetical protein